MMTTGFLLPEASRFVVAAPSPAVVGAYPVAGPILVAVEADLHPVVPIPSAELDRRPTWRRS